MNLRRERSRKIWPYVLVDVNTQRDFLDSEGACPIANREMVVPMLRRVVAWAKRNHIPVISTVDCHRPCEVRYKPLPQHCVDGSHGQEKLDCTLFGSYVKVESDNTLSVPADLFRRHQQAIFRKRTTDFFLNPKADRFVTQLPAEHYVVTGVSLEGSVKSIVLGLIARHRSVTVVVDSCGYFDPSESDLALRLMEAKGVEMISAADLATRKPPLVVRYPHLAIGQVCLRNGLYASITSLAHRNGTNGRNGSNGKHHVHSNRDGDYPTHAEEPLEINSCGQSGDQDDSEDGDD